MRWNLSIKPHQFRVEQEKGLDNANADKLSCLKTEVTALCKKEGGMDVTDINR